jgi:hypothetical protein
VKTLEEIAYEAGRDALADQEAVVAGVRQRTGTLLAAQALVASFLGGTTIRETGLDAWSWIAVALLVAGLVAAAVLLAPWDLRFSVDPRRLYDELYEAAAAEAEAGTLGWLASAGYGYKALRDANHRRVAWMSRISGALGVLMVLQTPVVVGRPGGRMTDVAPKPVPPDQIETPSTSIGISELAGGATPRPRPKPPEK